MSAAGYLLNKRTEYNPYIDADIKAILDDFNGSIAYHRLLPDYEPTPMESLPELARKLGIGNIHIKNEGVRFGTSALKILGASFAIDKTLSTHKETKGICTATDGNHGRAVAWVARRKNVDAVIFVPHHTASSRIQYIENEGATVIISKGEYDDAVNEAAAYADKHNYTLVQDTAWDNYTEIPALITAGYYTQMQEVYAQTCELCTPKIDVIFIQAGVGSWPSAVVHFIRKFKQNNDIKIVCVEPYESDAIYESMMRSALASTRKSQHTIMAGLNCGTPSSLAFEILKNGTDVFEIISDQYALDAIKYLNAPLPGDPYIAAGESGSAGLAGLLAITENSSLKDLKDHLKLNKSSNVLLFNTETVTDPILFEKIMSADSRSIS